MPAIALVGRGLSESSTLASGVLSEDLLDRPL